MANGKRTRAYFRGFGTVWTARDLDQSTLTEILRAFDSGQEEDPLLTPWKRAFNADIRSALGH